MEIAGTCVPVSYFSFARHSSKHWEMLELYKMFRVLQGEVKGRSSWAEGQGDCSGLHETWQRTPEGTKTVACAQGWASGLVSRERLCPLPAWGSRRHSREIEALVCLKAQEEGFC